MNNVTLVVKTFERREAVKDLYASIRKFYPKIKIIIVDDSNESMDTSLFDNNVEYIYTDFDIGLSAGRNLGVSKVKTKYFVLLDDDFLFVKETNLNNMLEVLEFTDFKLVGAGVHDFGKIKRTFTGIFKEKNSNLYLIDGKSGGVHQGYKKYDFILNFFMAETSTIKENPWDNNLKVAEHEDFFWNLKKKNILITDIKSKVFICHYPIRSGNYDKFRKRFYNYMQYSAKKNGFKKIVIVPILSKRISNFGVRSLKLFKQVIVRLIPPYFRKIIKNILGLQNEKN